MVAVGHVELPSRQGLCQLLRVFTPHNPQPVDLRIAGVRRGVGGSSHAVEVARWIAPLGSS